MSTYPPASVSTNLFDCEQLYWLNLMYQLFLSDIDRNNSDRLFQGSSHQCYNRYSVRDFESGNKCCNRCVFPIWQKDVAVWCNYIVHTYSSKRGDLWLSCECSAGFSAEWELLEFLGAQEWCTNKWCVWLQNHQLFSNSKPCPCGFPSRHLRSHRWVCYTSLCQINAASFILRGGRVGIWGVEKIICKYHWSSSYFYHYLFTDVVLSKSRTAAIAGGVIGAFLVVAGVISLSCFCKNKKIPDSPIHPRVNL